jgi:chromosome partitioning protein
MRRIALLTHKGGSGKTTLAVSLAVAAAATGEKVIALDFDPQGSLTRWGRRRPSNSLNKIGVEQFGGSSQARLAASLRRLDDAGFTLAIFDTPGGDSDVAQTVAEAADICLLPARPTVLDIEATVDAFRAACLANCKAAFVLNQCPATPRSVRAREAALMLSRIGVLAAPLISARIDYQDAIAAGLGVTEYVGNGRAAGEIKELWGWVEKRILGPEYQVPSQVISFRSRLAAMARYFG